MDILDDPTLSDKDRRDITQARAFRKRMDAGLPLTAPTTNGANVTTNQNRHTGSGAQSVRHAFSLLVASAMQRNPHWTRQQAIAHVARTEPGLHQEYLRTLPATGPRGRK